MKKNRAPRADKLRERRSSRKVAAVLLFVSLVLSLAYSAVRLALAPAAAPPGQEYTHLKSDYALMCIQCLLGLFVLGLPSLISHRWKLDIPNFIYIMYYVFLYCAIFLGEVLDFYYRLPHWDTILHFFSGAMLGALGFILVQWLNDDTSIRVSLSPSFVALFAFCFALSCGSVWEIYEFTVDHLLGLNMQKYSSGGIPLEGHLALMDTMKDLMVDALAAFIISFIGYLRLKLPPKADPSGDAA